MTDRRPRVHVVLSDTERRRLAAALTRARNATDNRRSRTTPATDNPHPDNPAPGPGDDGTLRP